MVALIQDLGPTTFSLNGIPYHKNFIPVVAGDKLRILNTYDSRIEIVSPSLLADFTVDGNQFGTIALLQAALLPVLFTRSSLAGININGQITAVDFSGNILTFDLADSSIVNINLASLDQAQGLANHIADTDNPHGVEATDVGLGNVDNTSDADKPISDAQQLINDNKADKDFVMLAFSATGSKLNRWVIGSGVTGINSGGMFIGFSTVATPTLSSHLSPKFFT